MPGYRLLIGTQREGAPRVWPQEGEQTCQEEGASGEGRLASEWPPRPWMPWWMARGHPGPEPTNLWLGQRTRLMWAPEGLGS